MGQLYSHLVFRPPPVVSYQSVDGYLKYVLPDVAGLPTIHKTELVWLLTSLNVRIPCAWVRHPDAEFVILYAHQNGEDLGSSIQDAHTLSRALAVDVFTFEYSGYGLSEKSKRHANKRGRVQVQPSLKESDRTRVEPSEKACCSDIDAAYAYLVNEAGVHPSQIIVSGRSIGSGPAVYCAASQSVAGLVLIAPIASAVRVALKRLNITLPFIDTFPNIDRVSKIRCPVLVVHGDMDELVPKLHGERLVEKIKRNGHAVKPLWIPEAKHNNVVEDFQSVVFGRYTQFLEELKQMKYDRASLEGMPDNVKYQKIFPKSRRRRHPIACLGAPRTSIDQFSTCGQVGDDDRRSRDIRRRTDGLACHQHESYLSKVRKSQSWHVPAASGKAFSRQGAPFLYSQRSHHSGSRILS
ncbi:unnamed protein product [Chondrus crispus]|uniref:Peptidase S9 prolyl oligopeptidase catalytic domain-containing protein n=1 Tax=Chondrus crispus TaxID=2769 RepID=R7QQY3_CHOCR|nr:unnamed protein product [Chondrus crispus]CDF40168.1 unnamed protein product [Chondrus crispus]|eukprot:XP_005710462.1 unnamed protein product [Chondrus crispus]